MKAVRPLGSALRMEVESDPLPDALVNLVKNPNGELGGWGWVTPVLGSTMTGGHGQLVFYGVPGASYFTTEMLPVVAGRWVAASIDVGSAGPTETWDQMPAGQSWDDTPSYVIWGEDATAWKMRFEWFTATGTALTPSVQTPYNAEGLGPLQAPATAAYVRLRVDIYKDTTGANPVNVHTFAFDEAVVATATTEAALGTSRTNLVANPSFETNLAGWQSVGSVTLVRETAVVPDGTVHLRVTGNSYTQSTRVNLVHNPSFELNLTGWIPTDACTLGNMIGYASSGYNCLRLQKTTVSGVMGAQTTFAYSAPITAGRSYTISANFLAESTFRTVMAGYWLWRADGSSIGGAAGGPGIPDNSSYWVRTWHTLTPEYIATWFPGAAYISPWVYVSGSVVGEVHYVDAVMIEENGAVGATYFDGSTPDETTGDVTRDRSWQGPAHLSFSNEVTTTVYTATDAGLATNVPVVGGRDYWLSAYVAASGSAASRVRGLRWRVEWLDAGNAQLSSTIYTPSPAETTPWIRTARQVVAPPAAVTLRWSLLWDAIGYGETHLVDAAMVEQSSELGSFIVGSVFNPNLSYVPPIPYIDVLGPTHDITVTRKALDVGTLTANIIDAALDPSQSTAIRPGRLVRLLAQRDPGPVQLSYSERVLADGPSAYYRHDDTGALPTTMHDWSGHGRDGTYPNITPGAVLGASSLLAGAPSGRAVTIPSGVTGTPPATVATGAWMDTAEVSAELWFRPSAAQTNKGLLARYAANTDWIVWVNPSGKIAARFYNTGGTSVDLAGPAIVVGTTYHIVGTYRSGDARLYVNGVEVASSTTLTGNAKVSPCPILVGSYQSGVTVFPCLGTIDESAVYPVALTAAQVAAHYSAGTAPPPAAVPSGWQPIFTGRVQSAQVSYALTEPNATKRAQIELTAVDAAQTLANQKREKGYASIAELPEMLEGCGVPWNVNGSGSGSITATVVATNENASALDQVAVARDSALGFAWVDRMGVLQVWDRDKVSQDPVGDPLDEDSYADVVVAYNTEDLINEVTLKYLRINPDDQTTDSIDYPNKDTPLNNRDENSIAEWGVRSAEFTIQGMAEETSNLNGYVQAILAANATPRVQLTSMDLTIELTDDWTSVAASSWYAFVDLYDLLSVTCARASIADQPTRVTGIRHTISGPQSLWTTELTFTDDSVVAAPTYVPSPTVGGKTIGELLRPIGEITMWFGSAAAVPAGWLLCDGSLIPAGYPDLVALIGARVPNMTDVFPIGAGTRALGTSGGSPTKALTYQNMPPTMIVAATGPAGGGSASNSGGALAQGTSGGAFPHTVVNQGAGFAFDVMNPWRAVWFIIRAR